ncbi:MAG: MarR family transcriptional regulator [Rubrivivax sp.]|nr:MarR family transcriptional regulator [Rubrivivax sp.]
MVRETRPKTKRNALDQDLGHLLDLAHRRVGADLERVLAGAGVQRDEWRVLVVLADEQGRSMGELAQVVAMNHPTLTKLIDRMVAKGWVLRSLDERDSRRVLVYVTDLGLALARRLEAPVAEHRQSLSARLGARQARELQALLARLLDG